MKKQIVALLMAIIAMSGVAMARSAEPDEQPTASTCGVDVRKYLQLPKAPHKGNNDLNWANFDIGRFPVVRGGLNRACESELEKLGFEVKISDKSQVCGNMWGSGGAFFSRGCLPEGTRYAVKGLVAVVIDCGNPLELLLRELSPPPPPCLPVKDCPPQIQPEACRPCKDCPPCEERPAVVVRRPPGKCWLKRAARWCKKDKKHLVGCAIPVGIGVGLATHDWSGEPGKTSRNTTWVNDVD